MGNGTSLGRVRGLGSSHTGSHHWLMQRFTAVGNLLLTIWFAVSLLLLPDYSYVTMRDWFGHMVPSVGVGLLIISTFWHARLGMQIMIEDYVHDAGSKFAAMAALNLVVFGAVAYGLFCVVRLALGAA